MNIIQSVRNGLCPVHPQGYPFIVIFLICSIILGWLWGPLLWIGLILTIWCIYFFRNPERVVPVGENFIVSPADGKITSVQLVVPPENMGFPSEEMYRISVFMNIFSPHVNRIPADGTIKTISYKAGKFMNADLDKASEQNERNGLIIQTAHGDIGVVQVAGLIARRIVCWVKVGNLVVAGERFGLIRFGSRLDLYLPSTMKIRVATGQEAIAGETIFACWDNEESIPGAFRLD